MNSTLHYLFNDSVPLTSCPSLINDFFYEDRFTRLYNEGLEKIRSKAEEQEYHSLLKALEEINAIPNQQSNALPNHKAFYEKNIKWMDNKQKKIRENRANLQKDEDQKIAHKQMEHNLTQQNNAIYLPYDYIGPIKGWDRHFQEFVNKKTKINNPNPKNFKPIINENSRKLANFNSELAPEKVEDRLLRKGKDLNLKKEISKQQYELIKNFAPDKQKKKKTEMEVMETVEKLYNDAKTVKENKEALVKSHEEQYSFKPNINKREVDSSKRRPLYYIKQTENSQENLFLKKKEFNTELWDSFLKRNQNTLDSRKFSIENSKKTLITKEIEECSFKPEINPKTLRILMQSNRLDKGLLERQAEFKEKQKENFETLIEEDQKKFKEKCTFRPQISKSVEKLKEGIKSSPNKSIDIKRNNENEGYSIKKRKDFLSSKAEKRGTPNFNRTKGVNSTNEALNSKNKAIQDFEWIDAEIQSLLN